MANSLCPGIRKVPVQEIGSVVSSAQLHGITQRQEFGTYERASVVQFNEAIRELGWVDDYTACRCRVSRGTVWNWRNGLTRIDPDALILVTREAFGSGSVRVLRRAGAK